MVALQRAAVLALSWAAAAAATANHHNHHNNNNNLPSLSPSPIDPSPDAVEENAFLIFNSVHSAMRQWGSSLNHNGFALFPATVPRGTLLYHGNHASSAPDGPEWLAFEMEHAHAFGFSRRPGDKLTPPPKGGPPPNDGRKGEQQQVPMLSGEDDKDDDKDDDNKKGGVMRGFMHTFQASRNINLVYLDGMAAAKTEMGTVDTQDFILRDITPGDKNNDIVRRELQRALDICALITSWGYDGYIRMEIGFEIIMCDFSPSVVTHVSAVRQPTLKNAAGEKDPSAPPKGPLGVEHLFIMTRGATQRYDSIGAGRVALDFSHATSGLFYAINSSSSFVDRPDLKRIGSATREDRLAIRESVRRNAAASLEATEGSVDWQGVADMVVTRYADRIAALAAGVFAPKLFAREVEEVAAMYIDEDPEDNDRVPGPGEWPNVASSSSGRYSRRAVKKDPEAITRCRDHYLLPARIHQARWTETDHQFALAVSTVMHTICTAFLEAADTVVDVEEPRVDGEVQRFRELKEKLDWPLWKRCAKCSEDEICFVAMWPLGEPEDHWNPSCKNGRQLIGSMFRGYWTLGQ